MNRSICLVRIMNSSILVFVFFFFFLESWSQIRNCKDITLMGLIGVEGCGGYLNWVTLLLFVHG